MCYNTYSNKRKSMRKKARLLMSTTDCNSVKYSKELVDTILNKYTLKGEEQRNVLNLLDLLLHDDMCLAKNQHIYNISHGQYVDIRGVFLNESRTESFSKYERNTWNSMFECFSCYK